MRPQLQNRIAVFLVDDHPLVRHGLALLLEQGGFAVAGEAGGVQAALEHPALACTQIVVLDLSLEQGSGVDLIPALCRRGLGVVIYSMHEDPAVVRRALASGGAGYVTKREAAQSLAEGIRTVASGGRYISPRAAYALARQAADPDLSPQQQQLYDLLGQGCDTGEIAARLHVSPRTVETYCVRLMDKLGADGMKALRQRAIEDRRQRPV